MVIAAAFIQLRITTIFIHFIALHHERRKEKSDPRMVILVGEMRVLIRPQSVFGHGEINIQEAYFKDWRGKNDPLFTLQIHQLNVSDFYLPFTALACWIRLVVPTLGIHQIFTLDNM